MKNLQSLLLMKSLIPEEPDTIIMLQQYVVHPWHWKQTKSSAEQSKIIFFSTKRACKMKIIQHQREETLKRNSKKSARWKAQGKASEDWPEREKESGEKMASVFNEKSTLNEEFPEITQEQKTFISRAFTDLNSLLGICLNHRWYENFTNVLYNGHVVKISHKAKLPKLTITYWTIDESEEEGIDNTITVIEMLVDYLNGDLVFVEDGNDVLQYWIIILLCLIVCVFHCWC